MKTIITVEYIEQAELICSKLFLRFEHFWFITAEEDGFSIESEWFENFNYAKNYAEGFYDAIKEV